MIGVKFSHFMFKGIVYKKIESADSKRGGCTSEAGSLRDGGVFWY